MTEIAKKQKPYLKILDFKNVDSQETVTKFNSVISTLQRSLPYWCVLQAIVHQGVIETIKNATDATVKNLILKKDYIYLAVNSQ